MLIFPRIVYSIILFLLSYWIALFIIRDYPSLPLLCVFRSFIGVVAFFVDSNDSKMYTSVSYHFFSFLPAYSSLFPNTLRLTTFPTSTLPCIQPDVLLSPFTYLSFSPRNFSFPFFLVFFISHSSLSVSRPVIPSSTLSRHSVSKAFVKYLLDTHLWNRTSPHHECPSS